MKLLHYYEITTKLLHIFSLNYSYYFLYCSNCSSSIVYTLIGIFTYSLKGILRNRYYIPKSNSGISIIQDFLVVLRNYYVTTISKEGVKHER